VTDDLTVLVAVERFPSRIQPWLLNSLEQVVVRGGGLWIVSERPGHPSYPPKVDELGLRERTVYLRLGSPTSLLDLARRAATPRSTTGRRVRRGLRRLLGSGRLLRGPPRRIANRLTKSPAFGLDGVSLIHSHAMVTAYEFVEVAQVLDVPLVHTFHGLQPAGVPGLPEPKRRVVFDEVSVCLVNTEFAKRQLSSLGCPEGKIRVLPQGIVLDEFPFRPRAAADDAPLRVLTVGRLHRDKGHRYAIEAVRLLSERGRAVEYRIVGHGPYHSKLGAWAAEVGVGDRVTVVGGVDDAGLLEQYAWADVFLLPSVRDETGHHEETQGVVMQEAQASGKIVVATRTGGIPECLDDGRSAFVVEDRSGPAIADALDFVADHPERWEEWQRLGREWVEERFDIDVIGRELWALYGEVRCNRGASR